MSPSNNDYWVCSESLAQSDVAVPQEYSKDHNNRIPPLIFRTYQILPHTNSYFHRLYSYLDLLPQGPLVPQGGKAPLVP